MSADNEALARSFFEQADRGRTPVELCTAGFTAHFPGPPPMDLEGFDHRFEGPTPATSWVSPPVASSSLLGARRSWTLPEGRSPSCGGFLTSWV
jgi:hypothetical protein